ncbi:MAG: iron-containing alcohol dehydrogenase, partial [Clostridia bacterium]|nr:iron-containing alcohol dehydrogenase [Clostridia bacterium]
AITILMAEEGSAHDLCTQYPPDGPPVSPRLLRPKLPNVVVLTTPTTAANRAGAAVLDPTARRRLELFDPKVRPVAVIVDAEALLTAPLALFRSTAVSTFCGAVEALPFPVVNALSHADLRQAVELCRTFLPRLLEHPDDVDARLQLAAAALLSNRASDAMGGGGYGVATGLVHQLQARCGVDQGAALAVLTRPGLRFNREALAPGQARLAAALGVWREGMSPAEAGEAAEEEVAALLGSVGMPLRLRELGVPEAELPALAAGGLESFFVRTNPRPVTGPEALLALLREAW